MRRSNRNAWPSPPQGYRSPEQARQPRRAVPGGDREAFAQVGVPDEAPRIVHYEDESPQTYLVRDPDAQRVLVPKARAAAEPFPIERGQQALDVRLLRWSAYALLAVAVGGLGGIILGLPVVIVAAAQLADQAQRMCHWRLEHAGPNGEPPLPAAATTEWQRLRAAFWQGLVALMLGAVVFVLITGRVL